MTLKTHIRGKVCDATEYLADAISRLYFEGGHQHIDGLCVGLRPKFLTASTSRAILSISARCARHCRERSVLDNVIDETFFAAYSPFRPVKLQRKHTLGKNYLGELPRAGWHPLRYQDPLCRAASVSSSVASLPASSLVQFWGVVTAVHASM